MDQKNTIVKCYAHPNCLFNHNGICDNYVINIGENSRCQSYVETEDKRVLMCEHCDYYNDNGLLQNPCDKRECYMHRKENACVDFKIKRGLRAKCNFLEDAGFNLCSAACQHYDFKGACMYCQLRQEYLGSERLMKPCDLCAKEGSLAIKMKVMEFDKPNKNKSIIKKDPLNEPFDEEYEALFKPNKASMSDHLCDISCEAASYAEDGELYCTLIQDYPERPLRCSAYDDGGCDCPEWDKSAHKCNLPKCCWR